MTTTITKKQWAQALADMTGEELKKFPTVSAAQEAFEQAARDYGMGYTVTEAGIELSLHPEKDPMDETPAPADQSASDEAPAPATDQPTPDEAPAPADRAEPKAKEATIKLLSATNPKRPGSKSFDRFALYQDGMTVEAFLKAGGRRADLAWDAKHGFIAV